MFLDIRRTRTIINNVLFLNVIKAVISLTKDSSHNKSSMLPDWCVPILSKIRDADTADKKRLCLFECSSGRSLNRHSNELLHYLFCYYYCPPAEDAIQN